MNRILLAAVFALTAAFPVTLIRAADPQPEAPKDPNYEAGKAAVDAKNWHGAIDAFGKAAATDPKNADAQTMLAYSYRKAGDLDMAFKHYDEALRLDPRNRFAHEYIGEAYLMKGDLAHAKEHLAALDRICFFGCAEFAELKKAVGEYETQAAKK